MSSPMTEAPVLETRRLARELRRLSYDMISTSGFGFFGSCNSAADAYACAVTAFAGEHDEIILSKGHAAPLSYARSRGVAWADEGGYAALGSPLQGHPSRLHDPHTVLTSGSLGLTLALAVGRHEARREVHDDARTVVLVGESELQAGCALEAISYQMRAGAPGLVVLVDVNERQSGGDRVPWLPGVLPCDLAVQEVDGHDHTALLARFADLDGSCRIVLLVLRTSRSHGLSDCRGETRMSHLPTWTEGP
jgi:transketolase N-terminal domain/subunit